MTTKGRIDLAPRAAEDLGAMLEEIRTRNECVKLTASGLASWIISRFRAGHFGRAKEGIARAHFDRRAYLKGVLRNDGDIDEALRRVLKKSARKRRKSGKKD